MIFRKKLLIVIGLAIITIIGLTINFCFLRAKKVYVEAPLDFHPVSSFPVILKKTKNEHVKLYPVSKPHSIFLKTELESNIISRDSLLEFLYDAPLYKTYSDNEYKFYLIKRGNDGYGEVVQVKPKLTLYD
ncbi:hypothetical protein [Allomuricauda sp. F6463D]|uniref:hypothetical protein n=1 Tax=Allomuricauda sp. F6463D TaxID=2926409 RepID=UPI001FF1ADE7|nr:hypothetical protein [Muricauda sp. F6463D]MCK0161311.1 hypothetical protein [Muricauda sp. F6463D]